MRSPGISAARVALLGGSAAMLLGCGILELGASAHEAVVLETPESPADDQWLVTVELLTTDIAGATVVTVTFEPDDLACDDGAPLDPAELASGDRLLFERDDEAAEVALDADGEPARPPAVTGGGLEVSCG
ncbi:MAG: hypothetical protein WD638_12670 [Nitriliruptoraceae bacterium]